ncbi:MAG: M20/M25/M40 family metallo-hydrolase [Candidatus Latescibacterota bacterium]|nr:M20/M25/M40 family metallo-hydrolase [Candidatus Latescibacterota bacterium]MEE2727317.1 M20/M25/M40 family metallo-hydrolase [Candidatus Latescibacterota bacterium]
MNIEQRVCDAVDAAWVADRAAELVSVPSVTMNEQEACVLFGDMMRSLGLDVLVRPITPGRNNLYARIPGIGGGPTLLFNGHLDTIPQGACGPMRREQGRIYGRGSTDMKGGMAAMLGAAKALVDSGMQTRGDVWLTAVVGHEETEAQKDGPRALVSDLRDGVLNCDRILIVEGRDALWVMSMGSMVFTIRLTSPLGGRHTQYVAYGENPIHYVGSILQALGALQDRLDRETGHPLAGPERIDLGQVHVGDYFNRTPVHALLQGTRRWVPGRCAEEILAELKALVAPIAEEGGLEWKVEMEHEREPFETPTDDPAVRAVARAHRTVVGGTEEYVGMRIVGDANIYAHGTRIPTFYYGPSNETAHADEEWVEVRRLSEAAQVYALAAVDYCGMA